MDIFVCTGLANGDMIFRLNRQIVYTVFDDVIAMCGALQVLGVPSNSTDVDIVAELRSRLEAAGLVATSSSMTQQDGTAVAAAVAAEAAKHESTIAELKRNNESLKAKLKSIYKSSQDAKQRHAKDVAKLKKTVTELQQQQQRAREQQTIEAEKTGERAAAGAEVSGEVRATSTENRGGVVLPPVNIAPPQPRLSVTNPQANSAADPHHNTTVHPSATQPLTAPSAVTMPPLALPRNSPTTTPRAIPPTTAIVLPSLATADTSAYQSNTADQSPTSLRNQVCCFFP